MGGIMFTNGPMLTSHLGKVGITSRPISWDGELAVKLRRQRKGENGTFKAEISAMEHVRVIGAQSKTRSHTF